LTQRSINVQLLQLLPSSKDDLPATAGASSHPVGNVGNTAPSAPVAAVAAAAEHPARCPPRLEKRADSGAKSAASPAAARAQDNPSQQEKLRQPRVQFFIIFLYMFNMML